MQPEPRAQFGVLRATRFMQEWYSVSLFTRCTQVVSMGFLTLPLCAANYTPFRTEINYGPIPFDVYTMPNINASGDPLSRIALFPQLRTRQLCVRASRQYLLVMSKPVRPEFASCSLFKEDLGALKRVMGRVLLGTRKEMCYRRGLII